MSHRSKQAEVWRLGIGLCLALDAGCVAQHEGPSVSDTATSWLHSCARDRECSGDNRCLQGICTLPCRAQQRDICLSVHAQAQCEPQTGAMAACDLSCSRDGECNDVRAGLVCLAGHCRERNSVDGDPESTVDEGTTDSAQIDAARVELDAAVADIDATEPRPVPTDANVRDAEAGAPRLLDAALDDAEAGTPLALSNDPGCAPQAAPLTMFQDEQALESLLVGRWAPCKTHPLSPSNADPNAGLEFVVGGMAYGLTKVGDAFVRNGNSWNWQFVPPDTLRFGTNFSTSSPWFTLSPRSMRIGIDPTFPQFVPIVP